MKSSRARVKKSCPIDEALPWIGFVTGRSGFKGLKRGESSESKKTAQIKGRGN